MTFCEMHKPSGCGECPNLYVCQKRDFSAGEFLRGEKIVRVSKAENALVTETYDRVSGRWNTNFYYLDTLKHHFTKAI